MEPIVSRLIRFGEPGLRYKVRTGVLGEAPDSPLVTALRLTVKLSPRVQKLLSRGDKDGRIPHHPYRKWLGAHWVLTTLADLGYPAGDGALRPLRDQVYDWLLSAEHARKIPTIDGRVRRCASQEGNAVLHSYLLGLNDTRTEQLVQSLQKWQWPDGGWNCDRKAGATHSSYHESLIPLRALALHARVTGDPASEAAVERGVETFLKRRLYRSQSTGEVIDPAFTKLHYPYYWRYNVLYALRVMAEIGVIDDPRCADALDLLESKRLPEGGFPAEVKYYTVYSEGPLRSGHTDVDWGGARKRQTNPWVTADALAVLEAAGRL